MVTITISGRLDGLNEMIHANRTNKYKGAQVKKDNEKRVIEAVKEQSIQPIRKYPLRAVFKWYEPNKRRDWDNVISAQKYVLDGLQKAHIIEGDSQKHIASIQHFQYIDANNPRIELALYSVDDFTKFIEDIEEAQHETV